MSSEIEQTSASTEGEGLDELVTRIEANSDELIELLDLLLATKYLGDDLTPELKAVATEERESIEELRATLEDQDTLLLAEKIGDNVDTFIELIDVLEATKDLADDLGPELKLVATDAREPLEELRVAFEGQDTLLLLQKIGENTDTFVELLDLMEATQELLEDLTPELKAAATESRGSFEQLRLVAAGFADSRSSETDIDPYKIGQHLGNMFWLTERLGNPQFIGSVDAGLTAFTDETASKKLGPLGMVRALRDDDVQRALGQLVEFLRRMGASQTQKRDR